MSLGPDYSKYLSVAAQRRPPSAIRSLFPLELIPDMISMLAGKPNPETFPISQISLTLKPDPEGMDGEGKGEETKVVIDGDDLGTALQYGATSGTPGLVRWLTEFQSVQHGRRIVGPKEELKDGESHWRVAVGNGSQDLLTKAFTAIVSPGDTVLVEAPAYAGILPTLQMLDAHIVPVDSDSEGVTPEALESLVSKWTTFPSTSTHPFPKFLYTTPTGANPSGTTASEDRKRSILNIVREHKLLLFEDDPYYYLHFEKALGEDPVTRKRAKSYFALEDEEEGRKKYGSGWVLRFESVSKILSAGLRIGHLSGPNVILDAVDLDTSSANLQPNGVAQAVVFALLKHWGRDGFLRHADRVATFYRRRRDVFEARAHAVLGTGTDGTQRPVAEWVTPVAGMFLWLTLRLPAVAGGGEGDSFDLISTKARDAGVLVLPGISFMPGKQVDSHVRVSFSMIEDDKIEEGLRRLRGVVDDAWREAGQEL